MNCVSVPPGAVEVEPSKLTGNGEGPVRLLDTIFAMGASVSDKSCELTSVKFVGVASDEARTESRYYPADGAARITCSMVSTLLTPLVAGFSGAAESKI